MGLVLLVLYAVTLGLIGSLAVAFWRHRRLPLEQILGIWQASLGRQLGFILVYGIVGFVAISWIVNR